MSMLSFFFFWGGGRGGGVRGHYILLNNTTLSQKWSRKSLWGGGGEGKGTLYTTKQYYSFSEVVRTKDIASLMNPTHSILNVTHSFGLVVYTTEYVIILPLREDKKKINNNC